MHSSGGSIEAKEGPTDASVSKSLLSQPWKSDLTQRARKQVHIARAYPELEALPELISDFESQDWQGKMEALKISVELIKENRHKFIRSIHVSKYFDAYMKLVEDSN